MLPQRKYPAAVKETKESVNSVKKTNLLRHVALRSDLLMAQNSWDARGSASIAVIPTCAII